VISNPGRFEIISLVVVSDFRFLLCNDPKHFVDKQGDESECNIPHVNVIEFHFILFFIAKAKQLAKVEAQDTCW